MMTPTTMDVSAATFRMTSSRSSHAGSTCVALWRQWRRRSCRVAALCHPNVVPGGPGWTEADGAGAWTCCSELQGVLGVVCTGSPNDSEAELDHRGQHGEACDGTDDDAAGPQP